MEIQKRILSSLKSAGLKYSKINFDDFNKSTINDNIVYEYQLIIPEADFVAKDDTKNKWVVVQKLSKAQEFCVKRIKNGVAKVTFEIDKVEKMNSYDIYDGITIKCFVIYQPKDN